MAHALARRNGSWRSVCVMDRKSKKKTRLNRIQSNGISNSGLSTFLNDLYEMPEIVEDPPSRHQVDRALASVDNVEHALQELPLAEGRHFDWHVASMPKLLVYFAGVSGEFHLMSADLHARFSMTSCTTTGTTASNGT